MNSPHQIGHDGAGDKGAAGSVAVTADTIARWRSMLGDLRDDCENAVMAKGRETGRQAFVDAVNAFDALDAELGEAWVDAQRAEVLR